MSFYILITKTAECERIAQYHFEGNYRRSGMFEIDKASGEVSLIAPMPGDEKGYSFNRAAVKILREWKSGNLPEKTEWAS